MKHIKQLIIALVAAVGLSACTDADVPELATYPEALGLGTWQSENTADGFDYEISVSLSAEGDTIANLLLTQQSSGARYALSQGTYTYDKQIGVATFEFAKGPFYGLPCKVYLARQHGTDRQTIQMIEYYYYDDGTYSSYKDCGFNAIPTPAPEIAGGTWATADGTFLAAFDGEGTMQYVDYTAQAQAACTYTYTAGTGTITLDDGTTGTIAFNQANQLVITLGQNQYTLFRQ